MTTRTLAKEEPLLFGLRTRLVRSLPLSIKEDLLFGQSRLALPSQIIMSHFLGGPRKSYATINGMTLECFTTEKFFFLEGRYEAEVARALLAEVRSDYVVYDVGAFIGYWVLQLSRQCQRVFAFEPSPTSFARMQCNVSLNSCGNVEMINKAVSDCNGFLTFSEQGSTSHSSEKGECTVPTIQLDEFVLRNPPPNVLLIDVEGSAGSVLRGARVLLRDSRPTVICEIHNRSELSEIEASLSLGGYRYRALEQRRFPYHIIAKVS